MATVNDILRAVITGVQLDSNVFNLVMHYRVTAGTEGNYDTIAAAIATRYDTSYSFIEGRLVDDVVSGELELSEWDFASNEWDGKSTVTCTSIVGGAVTDPEPAGISFVLRFITEELRRQGRKFIPGVAEVDVVGSTVQAAALGPLASVAASLNDDITAGGVTLRPCTFNDKPLSPRFETSSDFTSTAFVNSQVGYQRRRQPGDGV